MKKMLNTVFWALLISFTLAFTGCGRDGGSSVGVTPSSTSASKVSLSSKEIYLPDGISTVGTPTGDFKGAVLNGGTSNEIAGFVAEKPELTTTAPAPMLAAKTIYKNDVDESENNTMQAPLAATSSTGSADAVLAAAINAISQLTYVSTVSNIYKTNTQNPDTAVTQYTITLSSGKTPLEVSNDILQLIGLNKIGGTVSNLPSVSGVATATSYRMSLTVQYYSATAVVVIVSLVPENSYSSYAAVIASLGDGSNVVNTAATLNNTTDSFTGQSGGGKADFLFVIDNSGSMGDDQTALSQAGTAFGSVIQSAGLDYRIGVITTDSDVLSTMASTDNVCSTCTSSDPFTNDLTEFNQRIVQGTSGSSTETGIYWAERALLTSGFTTSYVYSGTGSVTQAGYPRSGASLSVIILSDEEDQYKSLSGNVAFDISNNIFVSKGYRVYSIVDSNDASTSQYDELSIATGGSTADINDLTTFPAIMQSIATSAGGAASSFVLTKTPLSGTIKVTVNGSAITNSATNGWQYIASSKSIVFYGTAIPQQGASVSVSYQYVQ